jgi:hypothetical protein
LSASASPRFLANPYPLAKRVGGTSSGGDPIPKEVSLDPSQVEDRRGEGPMVGLSGGGLTVGGGGLGLIGLVALAMRPRLELR